MSQQGPVKDPEDLSNATNATSQGTLPGTARETNITEPPKKVEAICGTDISSRGGCILEVRPLLPGTDLGWHMLPFQICRLPLGIAGIVGISGIRQLELNFSHSEEITSDLRETQRYSEMQHSELL
ncbi:hypothetical protein LAZ67_7001474 [Cordylochernes scorpioides]|uniref:Uncharacterized protein n=1 Tax=Cordylochernes scorpioides TaxID=51811 RepID=A0ABY6KNA8_9ARAC|nr:hypothetical protein LAZ67_7001474 [Cordylochernes scorpioides]